MIEPSELVAALLIVAMALAISLVIWGNKTKCPVCGRRWASSVERKELVDVGKESGQDPRSMSNRGAVSGAPSSVPFSGEYKSYLLHMKCRYCNTKWVRGRTED
jgi:hypothetical protein